MPLGRKRKRPQDTMWVATSDLPKSPGHPFYQRLNQVLAANSFDSFVEAACRRFYAAKMGRPSLPPGRYFRLMLLGTSRGWARSAGWRGARRTLWLSGASSTWKLTRGRPITRRFPGHVADRRGDAPAGVHLGAGAAGEGGSAGRQDDRDRRDDAGGERGDAEHCETRHGSELR